MKKIWFLIVLCLVVSSMNAVYAANMALNDNSIVIIEENGQKITIRNKTYEEYIIDLAKYKGISVEEAVILDKLNDNEVLFSNDISPNAVIITYPSVEIEGYLDDNDNFSALLITQLKIRSDHHWKQIEDVIYQDIHMESGGGYNTQIISKTCGTDPATGSSEFPVDNIFMSGVCQFQVTYKSSSGIGIDIPGFSYHHDRDNIYYYHSRPLYINHRYTLY